MYGKMCRKKVFKIESCYLLSQNGDHFGDTTKRTLNTWLVESWTRRESHDVLSNRGWLKKFLKTALTTVAGLSIQVWLHSNNLRLFHCYSLSLLYTSESFCVIRTKAWIVVLILFTIVTSYYFKECITSNDKPWRR